MQQKRAVNVVPFVPLVVRRLVEMVPGGIKFEPQHRGVRRLQCGTIAHSRQEVRVQAEGLCKCCALPVQAVMILMSSNAVITT